jgi:hypothetical protein
LGIIGIGLAGCDEDCTDETNIDCPNYDPCYNAMETSASFRFGYTVGIQAGGINHTFYTDTFLPGQRIGFFADEQEAEYYEWKIGVDDRTWDTPYFSLYFDDDDSLTLYNAPIEVRLITHKTPRTDCYPNDDGIDTSYRYIHFLRPTNVFLGTWRGSLSENPNEVYEIKLYIDSSLALQPGQNYNYDALYIDNLYNEQMPCNIRHMMYDGFKGKHRTDYSSEVDIENLINCSGGGYTGWRTYSMIIEVNTQNNTIYLEWFRKLSNEGKRVFFKGERI